MNVHLLVQVLGGVAYLAAGALVLWIQPRAKLNRSFALYSLAAGALFVVEDLAEFAPGSEARSAVLRLGPEVGFLVLAHIGLVGLFAALPGQADRRLTRALASVGPAVLLLHALAIAPAGLTALPWTYDFPEGFSWSEHLLVHLRSALFMGLLVALGVFLWLASGLHARVRESGPRRDLLLICLALGIYAGYQAGGRLANAREYVAFLEEGVVVWAIPFLVSAVVLLAAGRWLWNGAKSGQRAMMHFAWVVLGSALAALVIHVLTQVADNFGFGVARIASSVLLAYSIVRHQAFGFERRLRFTIRSTTLGAIFITVFFVASEAAQQVFSQRAGPYVGIAAAGGLVFVLAPLQHLADRVAKAAVPSAADAADGLSSRRLAYQETARRLLADGELSPRDERILANLAQELGIGARDALDLRVQATQRRRRSA